MALKAVKCPSCSGDLNLDDDREFGFCQYCGTKVMLRETINVVHSGTVQLDNSGKVKNRMKLARDAYEDGKYKEAYEHYTNVLEDEPEQCEALTRRGICASYIKKPYEINANELTRGYKEAIEILQKRMNNGSSEEEKESIKKELQSVLNDMTNFVINLHKITERFNLIHPFDSMQTASEVFNTYVNIAKVLDKVNEITPSEFEDNLRTQYRIQYNICNNILSLKINYISGYSVNKNGVSQPKIRRFPISNEIKMQILQLRVKAMEAYNSLPSIAAALDDLTNTLKKHTDDRDRIQNELVKTKAESLQGIDKFWKDNPQLYKELKAKKRLTWIAGLIGFIAFIVMGLIGSNTELIYLNFIGFGVFLVSLLITRALSKKVQSNYEDSVFPAEIKDTRARIISLTEELKAVNTQIYEANNSIRIYKRNNYIGKEI